MQKTIENGIIVLTADSGMKLTNGNSFGSTVRLGVHDIVDNWNEVTQAETEKMIAEQEEEDISDSEALAILTGGAV